MKTQKANITFAVAALIIALSWTAPAAHADQIVDVGNITDFFGDGDLVADADDAAGLLFDETRTGGSDTNAGALFTPARALQANAGTNNNWANGLNKGTAGTISFTGIGFALRGGTTADSVDLTIVYLGGDEAFGTADDVVVGTTSDSLQYDNNVSEYGWRFTNAIDFAWDGLGDRFRFEMAANNGNLRFKSRPVGESPSGQGGLTFSVGGSFSAVPEPSGLALVGVLMACMGLRRRR